VVRPGLAVASLARRNRFGFPHHDVVRRYQAGASDFFVRIAMARL
jgi:beta-lactamase superfamily II metal-dependent hydrolase